MTTKSSTTSTTSTVSTEAVAPVDVQKLFNGVVELELKALGAGVEYAQVWISQAAKLSAIAADTLQAMQDGKASLPDTAQRLTEFGKQNVDAFGEVGNRLGKRYVEELGRFASVVGSSSARVAARAVEAGAKTVGEVTEVVKAADAAAVKASARRTASARAK